MTFLRSHPGFLYRVMALFFVTLLNERENVDFPKGCSLVLFLFESIFGGRKNCFLLDDLTIAKFKKDTGTTLEVSQNRP